MARNLCQLMAADSLDNWFKREILVHEASLMRFLVRAWSNSADVLDLRQDIYVRIYEAAAHSRPLLPRSFLFATARHLITDRLRRQRVVAIDAVGDLDSLNVLIEEINPERRLGAHQELRRLAQALDELPPKCRETVWLRRVFEMPQKEVAARLGITEKTVEKHLMKGMRLLADAMLSHSESNATENGERGREPRRPERGKP
jgi:RNA polymerase sigma-70 factor (ECF subfamily)